MKKIKTVLVFSFTLGIFVVSLCVPTLFGQVPQRGSRPMMQNQPRARLPLPELTDEQKEQMQNLRETQMEVQKQFMERTKELNLKLNELKQDPAANAGEIEKIQDTKFNLRMEQMKNSYMHQKEVRKIFTPEQLEKMPALRTKFSRGRTMMNMNSRMPQRNQNMRMGINRGRGRMSGQNRFFQRDNIWRRR